MSAKKHRILKLKQMAHLKSLSPSSISSPIRDLCISLSTRDRSARTFSSLSRTARSLRSFLSSSTSCLSSFSFSKPPSGTGTVARNWAASSDNDLTNVLKSSSRSDEEPTASYLGSLCRCVLIYYNVEIHKKQQINILTSFQTESFLIFPFSLSNAKKSASAFFAAARFSKI